MIENIFWLNKRILDSIVTNERQRRRFVVLRKSERQRRRFVVVTSSLRRRYVVVTSSLRRPT